jgi:hypothetical protein
MGNLERLAAQQKKRDAALKDRKELSSRLGVRRNGPPKADGAVAPSVTPPASIPPASPPPKPAVVRLTGDCILNITAPDCPGSYLVPALHECVDLYLQVAQCHTREIVLLWPGSLDCLPLIHALATIEYWAQGHKNGLRGALYPATSASFRRLNNVFANRDDIWAINSDIDKLPPYGVPPADASANNKSLMLWALNSLKDAAREAGLQPCLNELLPHFFLETGERKELLAQNYGSSYLSHLVRKLSARGHSKDMRERVLPELGRPTLAPDAIFGLSFRMTRSQMEQALRTLKSLGPMDAIIVDATRTAFERVGQEQKRLESRVVTLVRLVTEVFGDTAPGLLVVTDDPRQMTLLRTALAREEKTNQIRLGFGATHALRLGQSGRGLQPTRDETMPTIGEAMLQVEIVDRESSRVVLSGYRLTHERGITPPLAEALVRAARHVQTMANLPSSADLLHKWLDESMADEQQRRRFDWVAIRNSLMSAQKEADIEVSRMVRDWVAQATVVLEAQSEGTPLARALVDRVKRYTSAGKRVLVVVRNQLYADLGREYFLRDPVSEQLAGYVNFVALRTLKDRLAVNACDHIITCAISPDFLRWVITSPSLPCPLDFFLTQHTALAAYYALAPVLALPAYAPYVARVRAIHDPIREAQGAIGAVIPTFDYEPPTFTLTTANTGAGTNSERGPTDYVDIELEDGRHVFRGLNSRVYVYDPAAKESRAMGFRPKYADRLEKGDQLFVMSDSLREEAEAAFARAGVVFDDASRYERNLRDYHAAVRQRVTERFGNNIAEAARCIKEAMQAADCGQEAGNIRYWINLRNAEGTPFAELMPQAPRHFETFKVFMNVLGFDATTTQVFWDGAVKRVRGTRITDGLNLGDHYDRVIFSPEDAATYDRLTPEVLNPLRSRALDNVYEVAGVCICINEKRGS